MMNEARSRRRLLRFLALASISLAAASRCQASEMEFNTRGTSPNIVFILADDMGIGDISSYNAESLIDTPYLV